MAAASSAVRQATPITQRRKRHGDNEPTFGQIMLLINNQQQQEQHIRQEEKEEAREERRQKLEDQREEQRMQYQMHQDSMMHQQQFLTTMLMMMQGNMQANMCNNVSVMENIPPPHLPLMRFGEPEGKEEEKEDEHKNGE